MKILQITPYFHPRVQGMETYALNLSRSLSQRGHQVDVLTVNTENALEDEVIADNINVHRSSPNLKYRKVFVSLEVIRKLLKAKDYDLYHIHTPFPFGVETAIVASRINHIPLVVTYQCEGTIGTPDILYAVLAGLYNLYSWFGRSIIVRFASRVIFLSRSYPEFLGLGTKLNRRIRVIRPGVDVQRFSPRNDGSKLRAKYGFHNNDRVLLFVGSLRKSNRYKGVDYLLKAMRRLRNRNNHVKLVIVGGGELVAELEKLAQELNLRQDVIFTGSVTDEELPFYYAMCDVFVLPSIHRLEAFGLVLFEAMASGKPCIASDLPGVREAVKNEKTGLLVPPKDPEALAQAVQRLVEDDGLRSEMAQNARRDMESASWQKCAEEIEAVYSELVMFKEEQNAG